MNVLTWLALFAVIFGAGYGTCYSSMSVKAETKELKAAVAVAKVETKQAETSNAVEAKVIERIKTVYVKGDVIIKEVPIYVPADTPDLPPGFRVHHDAAATGEVPDPASVADADPVPAQDLAKVIAENYQGCRANEEMILGWQDWAARQSIVLPNPEGNAP